MRFAPDNARARPAATFDQPRIDQIGQGPADCTAGDAKFFGQIFLMRNCKSGRPDLAADAAEDLRLDLFIGMHRGHSP